MTGSISPFHDGFKGAKRELPGIGGGVHFLHGRHEQVVASGLFQHVSVCFRRSGIGFQVFGVVELSGVDKHTGHAGVVFGYAALDKADVPLVQGSHGGNKADGTSFLA